MNMTARLFTQPSLAFTDTSRDVYDMVGVFVGDDLRELKIRGVDLPIRFIT